MRTRRPRRPFPMTMDPRQRSLVKLRARERLLASISMRVAAWRLSLLTKEGNRRAKLKTYRADRPRDGISEILWIWIGQGHPGGRRWSSARGLRTPEPLLSVFLSAVKNSKVCFHFSLHNRSEPIPRVGVRPCSDYRSTSESILSQY